MLEGSIQRQADQMRVTAQLIDATSGAHVWSERWDRPAQDVFAVQTEVAELAANSIGGHGLLPRERAVAARRKRPGDLAAYDLLALGYEAEMRGTELDLTRAMAYTDAAIAKDPGMARAFAQKAFIVLSLQNFRKNWEEALPEMERLARAALDLDPYDAWGWVAHAVAVDNLGRNAEAAADAARAVELNPSSADILNSAAASLAHAGKAREGAAWCDRSFHLNPTPPDWYYVNCLENYVLAQRNQDALNIADRYVAHLELGDGMLVMRAVAQTGLGLDEAAAETAEEFRRRYPEDSLEFLLDTGWTFVREQDEQLVLTAARKAGIRICATNEELKGVDKPARLPECDAERVKAMAGKS